MITVSRTVVTALDARAAFEYLSAFEHTGEWDPGTPVVEKTSDGPVAVGSTYHAVAEFRGKRQAIDYVVTDLGDDHIELRGENKTVVGVDTIVVERADGGSRVTYTARFELKGWARFVTPFVGPLFESLGDPAAKGLRERLNVLAAAGAGR